ncbi:MAG: 8-amino-7-oxononanoate synthase [Verrucomicrobia bacterium]|nr:8-amino-7-oxononanoate synthase [Verrucomicrobiota bacterium]
MNEALLQRLRQSLAQREGSSLRRKLTARAADDSRVNLADNDYLGLSRDPAVIAAGMAALQEWGASAAASPLVTGYTEIHQQLERTLAAWQGYAHALVMNTGFAANSAVLGGLPKKGDVVLADRLVHASMLDGILASGARLRRFAHNDLDALELMLHEEPALDGVIFVVTESVYSMDGDSPDLPRLAALRKRFGFCWVLDEAHATGWYGATGTGLQEARGVPAAADIVVGTLGKGLGSQGAYVLSHAPEVRDALINFAGEFVYSTYLAPSCAAAALAAIGRVRDMSGERGELHALSQAWRDGLVEAGFAVPTGDSPIIPLILGDSDVTLRYATALRAAGFMVSAIRPPTVPVRTGRIRISLRRGISPAVLSSFVSALKGVSP